MNLTDFLRAAPVADDHPAMIYGGVTLSRKELFERVDQVAAHWLLAGLRPGDGIALALRHPAVHLVCLLAAARMGAVASVFKADAPGFDKEGDMYRLGCRTLVHDRAEVPSSITQRFDRVWVARDLLMGAPVEQLPSALQVYLSSDHSARAWYLPQSSGATGVPKSVVVNQSSTRAAVLMGEPYQSSDRVVQLTDITMYWSVWNVFRMLHAGAICVPGSTRTLPGPLLHTLQATAANKLVLSTDAAGKLLSYCEDFGTAALAGHRLQQVTVGGAQVSEALAKGLHAFLGAQVRVGYGSTEAGPTADLCGAESQSVQHLQLYAGVEAEVVDEAGQALPQGQQGRLRIRSAALFSGYLQDGQWPQDAPQWFYPGDLAVLHGSRLQLMGRADHMLNLGGFKVDPERLELDFRAQQGVLDAAILAVPLGRKQVLVLVALLVLQSEDHLAEVRATFERTHGKAMHPQHYVLAQELPRNLAGQLQRGLLQTMVSLEPVPGWPN
jgi:acyl-coenzyme A synthetase/AMP-(fatty) acid ligase